MSTSRLPFNVTAFAEFATKATRLEPHVYHGNRGGKVPGIRRENRRYPDGKPADPESAAPQVVQDQAPTSAPPDVNT